MKGLFARAVGLAGVLGLVAAACGPAAAPTPTAAPPQAPTQAPRSPVPTTAVATVSPTPTSAPVRPAPTATAATASPTPSKTVPQGKVTIVRAADWQRPDPHKFTISPDYVFGWAIWDSLVGMSPEGKPVPHLATSWKMLDGGRTWEFTLRKGVRFHSGDPLTAADIKFSHERIFGPEGEIGNRRQLFQGLKSLEVADDLRVVFRLADIDALFATVLGDNAWIVPKAYIEKNGEGEFKKTKIGAGPYKFTKHLLGQQVELEAYEDYWGQIPNVKTVVIANAPEEQTRVAMLKTGEADIIEGVPPHMASQIESDARLWVKRMPVNIAQILWFDTLHKTNPDTGEANDLLKKDVRLAFIMAVDRKAIIARMLMGQADELASVWGPNGLGYDPAVKPYPYDPAKATELLRAANFNFDQVYPVYVYTASPGVAEAVEAVSAYLNAAGVKTKYRKTESGTMMSLLIAKKAYAVHLIRGGGLAVNDPWPTLFAQTASWAIYSSVLDAGYDKLLTDARSIIDVEARNEHLKKLYKYVHDNALALPLYQERAIWGMWRGVDWDLVAGSFTTRGLEYVRRTR